MKAHSAVNEKEDYFIRTVLCRHPLFAWIFLFIGVPFIVLLLITLCVSGISALYMLFGAI